MLDRKAVIAAADEIAELRARCEKAEKDAARFNTLLGMPMVEAQAVFWNMADRKARIRVIDAAIAKERTS